MCVFVCVCVCVSIHAYIYLSIYIYIYIYIEECMFRHQIIIQVSFVKDDGTLFIIFNFIFSSFLVNFLVSISRW